MILIKITLITSLMIFSLATAFSQSNQKKAIKHKVVMQVTQGDSLTQLSVIGQLRNIKKSLPESTIEVVFHANSLDMVVSKNSKVADHLKELALMDIHFVACENTMQRKKIAIDDLVPGVKTVPSGLVEIILKQEEGWSYLKGGF